MSFTGRVLGRLRWRWWIWKARYLRLVHGYHHSGERVCPDFPDENFLNHVRVYEFAGQFASGRRVLDVGCGTGYGTAFFLKCGAASAQGIDLSTEAISYARRRFGRSGARFEVMDAQAMDLENESFDMVYSSENLEHLPNPDACIKEIRRTLKTGGILILGTPNAEMDVDEKGTVDNPYHVKEFTFEEVESMLRPLFRTVVIFENSLESPTPWGRGMKEARSRRGKIGIATPILGTVEVDGLSINCAALHNTHSFMVVAR
jgi:2-polyprenyl-3-methyl-5-hydroxy-6-metoxy-1,4-benzoquinol methylase